MAIDRVKLTKSAQKHLAKGNLARAVEDYEKLVASDPENARELLRLGDIYTKQGNLAAACETYSKVANQYAEQGAFLKAVPVLKQILKLEPTRLDAHEQLADMYERLSLTSDAIASYEQVAEEYTRGGKLHKALHALSKIATLDDQNVAARIRYAEALSKAERFDDAIQAFEQGADLLLAQGRPKDYIKVTERLLYHQPDNLFRTQELARIYLEQGEPRNALAKLQPCFKADPSDLTTLSLLARVFAALDQTDKAVAVYREMGRLHADAGRTQEQIEVLQAILVLVPDDDDTRLALESLLQLQPQAPAAPSAANDSGSGGGVILLDEESSIAHMPADELSNHFELDEELQAHIERLMTECEVFIKYGLHDKVEAQLHAVLTVAPHHLEARLKLAEHYVQNGYPEDAATQLLAAAELVRDHEPELAVEYCALAVHHHPESQLARERLHQLRSGQPFVPVPDLATQARQTEEPGPSPTEHLRAANQAEDDPDIIILDDDDDISELPLDDVEDYTSAPPTDPEALLFDAPIELETLAAESVPPLPTPKGPPPLAPHGATRRVDAHQAEMPQVVPAPLPPPVLGASVPPPPPVSRQTQSLPPPAPVASKLNGRAIHRQGPPLPPPVPPPVQAAPNARRATPLPAPPAVLLGADSVTAATDVAEPPQVPSPSAFTKRLGFPPAVGRTPAERAPQVALDPPTAGQSAPGTGSRPPLTVDATEHSEELDEALEEIEFYLAQGMTAEASDILDDALSNFPNHPTLVAKQAQMAALTSASVAPRPPDMRSFPPGPPPVPTPGSAASSSHSREASPTLDTRRRSDTYEELEPPVPDLPSSMPQPPGTDLPELDHSFALAEKLAAEEEERSGPIGHASETVDVHEVIDRFRAGVRAAVDPKDAATHYDLGIAYVEMGLHVEAIEEFRFCLDDPERQCQAHTMIGLSHVSNGAMTEAIDHFKEALVCRPNDQERLDLWFEIGNAYELLEQPPQALEYYEFVERDTPGYRDVAERLERLKTPRNTRQDDDEFDAMFDNMILKD